MGQDSVHVCVISSVWVFRDSMDCSPPGSSVHGISQAKIVSNHFLLQGISLIQGSNPGLWHLHHWQADSLPVVLLGKSRDSVVPYKKCPDWTLDSYLIRTQKPQTLPLHFQNTGFESLSLEQNILHEDSSLFELHEPSNHDYTATWTSPRKVSIYNSFMFLDPNHYWPKFLDSLINKNW